MAAPPAWFFPALFPALALLIGVALPLYAWRARGRQYAAFAAVVALISFPTAALLASRLTDFFGAAAGWCCAYLFIASGMHATRLVRARLRHPLYRYAVSLPGMALQALGALSLPYFAATSPLHIGFWFWGNEAAQAAMRWLDLLPVVVVMAALAASFGLRRERVRFAIGAALPPDESPADNAQLIRLPVRRTKLRGKGTVQIHPPVQVQPPTVPRRPLRIVQITDPHLGPWQPVRRLQRRLEELLLHQPDLVLLTGDYLTMEGNGSPGCLVEALAPLRAARGRCFACLGNHDHEAPGEVQNAMRENGIPLLVDSALFAETTLGPVQILGADFHRRGRAEQLAALFAAHPRAADVPRLLLLHDPMHFKDVPPGEVDLTFSGHTHGGQLGLLAFGIDWTVLRHSRWPDHGLFGRGRGRLYVHRGTGFYGFPLRVGVPGEASLLEVTVQ